MPTLRSVESPVAVQNQDSNAHAVPLEVLLKDVYESSEEPVRSRILNLLVGRAYAAAPPAVRKSLLEQLLLPLGILGLVSVAGGVFAKMRLRSGLSALVIRIEDLQEVRTSDVIALVAYVQQVSSDALIGAAQVLSNTPAMTRSGSVAVLASILLRRSRERRSEARLAPGVAF